MRSRARSVHHLRITLVQVDRDGRVLLTTAAPGTDDARLRRARAAAPTSPVGFEITRALLGAKTAGHAALARGSSNRTRSPTSPSLDHHATELATATDLAAYREIEAVGMPTCRTCAVELTDKA